MVDYTVKGTRVKTIIETTITELLLEAQSLFDRYELIEIKKRAVQGGITIKQAQIQVVNEILNETNFMNTWTNRNKKIIAELTSQIVAQPVNDFAKANPEQKFTWELGSVKTEHCPDCEFLSGETARTISEWREFGYGLPREGNTACNVGCNCMLNPV